MKSQIILSLRGKRNNLKAKNGGAFLALNYLFRYLGK
jgi:hypothetical protein